MANEVIEEAMILANICAAKLTKKLKTPIPFRHHDNPDLNELENLKEFLKTRGLRKGMNEANPRKKLNDWLKEIKQKDKSFSLIYQILRSMKLAVYSGKESNHFALGLEEYCHFTSPIRRYADLIIHRSLIDFLAKNRINTDHKHFTHVCNHISKMEKQAVEAERASIKYMQVKFLTKFIGKEFDGMISGLTEWGMYVELNENKCEGMIPLKSLADDQYFFDSDTMTVTGYLDQKSFKVGQTIRVIVKKTDLYKRQIDFGLVSS